MTIPPDPDRPPPRVLHVEDSEVDARLTAISIDKADPDAARLERVGTLAEALASIRAHAPDAILLDLDLPDSQGMSTLGTIARAAPRVPIIVFTGVRGPHIEADALRAGARALLAKDEAQGEQISGALRDALAHPRPR